jgi:hypothetical protein
LNGKSPLAENRGASAFGTWRISAFAGNASAARFASGAHVSNSSGASRPRGRAKFGAAGQTARRLHPLGPVRSSFPDFPFPFSRLDETAPALGKTCVFLEFPAATGFEERTKRCRTPSGPGRTREKRRPGHPRKTAGPGRYSHGGRVSRLFYVVRFRLSRSSYRQSV